jgi:multisubunit Na+/H+ antiporter MnhB subunit
MNELPAELIALAVHLVLALVTILIVLVLDIVEKEQKRAQIWVCLLVPFVGSLFIVSFTVNEKITDIKNTKSSSNNTAITDDHGIDLHIAQRQHESSSSDGSD